MGIVHQSRAGCHIKSNFRTLEGTKDELRSLSERASAVGYQENDADRHAISELVEELRDAIVEYQVGPDTLSTRSMLCLGTVQFAHQKSLYDQNCRLIVRLYPLCSRKDQVLTDLSRRQVRQTSTISRHTLTSQQPSCQC